MYFRFVCYFSVRLLKILAIRVIVFVSVQLIVIVVATVCGQFQIVFPSVVMRL